MDYSELGEEKALYFPERITVKVDTVLCRPCVAPDAGCAMEGQWVASVSVSVEALVCCQVEAIN